MKVLSGNFADFSVGSVADGKTVEFVDEYSGFRPTKSDMYEQDIRRGHPVQDTIFS